MIANATPTTASDDGRSPSATPTTSGMITAHTAVTGATTLITPTASPRYSSATPIPPASPAAAPHAKSIADGDDRGRNGSASSTRIKPDNWEKTTTEIIDERLLARPPRKSAAP